MSNTTAVAHNEFMLRFALRRMLRKVESGRWDGVSKEHQELATKILGSQGMFNVFCTSFMTEARAVATYIPENSEQTSGPFLDAMIQFLNWVKDNPEFILFIIQLFGAV